MALRLLPWAPEYGSSLQFDADDAEAASAQVDITVEGPWESRAPRTGAPAAVQIVDGVRRAEAHAMDDGPDGPVFGLFGSLAVGAVRCDGGGASIVEADRIPRVERRYLQTGGEPHDRELPAGTATLRFRAMLPPRARNANDLVAALNRAMLDEEALLADELSRDDSALTLVDGPLRMRSAGPRAVGYVKRIHQWYIGVAEQALLPRLAVGERTPLFRIVDSSADGAHERYAWFLRLADLGRQFHPLSGILRLEASAALPLQEASRMADESAAALPRLASSPIRDPRAPHNLTPVGALEAVLTHRLGDRLQVRRWIAAALSLEASPSELLLATNGAVSW